jgi:ribosomal protein S18 acetylase RimI-like enzyme
MQVRGMLPKDLKQVNSVFAKAFSNARVEEGLKRHRVSPCRLEFLKMYLDRSGEGAIVSEDRGRITGFNFSHLFGKTGWIGPVAVAPGYQGAGVGKSLVREGVDYLRARGATIIGLETMPRNFKNIGFYLSLGFKAGPLCVDMVGPAHSGPGIEPEREREILYFRERSEEERERLLEGAARIAERICPGLDYGAEIALNMDHAFGDTVMLMNGDNVDGFAVCHLEPYGRLEDRRELKVSVLAMRPEGEETGDAAMARLSALLAGVRELAAREKLLVVRVHPRVDKWSAVQKLIRWGYNVAYSDLRMWLTGFEETEPASSLHFCRWQ